MALTDAQVQALATNLANNTDQTVIDALAIGNNVGLTAWYNQQADPDYYVWRMSMSSVEMADRHFDWAEIVDNMSTNSLLALQLMLRQEVVDPRRASIRAAFQSLFSGPNLASTRNALVAAAKKLATNAEQLFATDGDGSSGTPASPVVESLSLDDIRAAVRLLP